MEDNSVGVISLLLLRDWTHLVMLGNSYLYLLSHLVGPQLCKLTLIYKNIFLYYNTLFIICIIIHIINNTLYKFIYTILHFMH